MDIQPINNLTIPRRGQKVTWASSTAPNSPSLHNRFGTFSSLAGREYDDEYENIFDSKLELKLGPRRDLNPRPSDSAIPNADRERLFNRIRSQAVSRIKNSQAQVGFISYVGSPINGDIVIGNPELVNLWLVYSRKAIKKKLVQPESSFITVNDLNKLCNVTVLPGERHEFNIRYEAHPEISCARHKHDKRIWESPFYPCTISSCLCSKN